MKEEYISPVLEVILFHFEKPISDDALLSGDHDNGFVEFSLEGDAPSDDTQES